MFIINCQLRLHINNYNQSLFRVSSHVAPKGDRAGGKYREQRLITYLAWALPQPSPPAMTRQLVDGNMDMRLVVTDQTIANAMYMTVISPMVRLLPPWSLSSCVAFFCGGSSGSHTSESSFMLYMMISVAVMLQRTSFVSSLIFSFEMSNGAFTFLEIVFANGSERLETVVSSP
ncbi:hypothetical protein PINS_up020694 [Pythium insidiosum]|nr:hypothetical protein PINS_up020694 [Pythium insidiosum]